MNWFTQHGYAPREVGAGGGCGPCVLWIKGKCSAPEWPDCCQTLREMGFSGWRGYWIKRPRIELPEET